MMADKIMLRFTACLLSAALPGSLLSFEIIYSHCQINSLRFSFQCPFLRHLRFWKLIYPVWHAVYDKSASKFDSYHNHLPCYYGMDHGCTELLQLFHNPCPVCVRTVLSLFLLLLYISKQPFQITDHLSVLFHPVTDWSCCFFYVFCISPLTAYIPQGKSLADIVILTVFVELDIM